MNRIYRKSVALSITQKQGVAYIGQYKYTKTVSNHIHDIVKKGPYKGELSRPYMNSPHTVHEIMKTVKPLSDPGGISGAYLWKVPGNFRGSKGTWELVAHPEEKIIYHYNFVR